MAFLNYPKFFIGIDLGTTNCALAYARAEDPEKFEHFEVPQAASAGSVMRRPILPSNMYLAPAGELEAWPPELLAGSGVVGRYAKDQLSRLPGRVTVSAKSWLCNSAIDRELPLLPWASEDISPSERLSPIQVSSCYLAHLRQAWNSVMAAGNPENRLERQTVVITVPASFDQAAQRLTLRAAAEADYPDDVFLLEEPQAVFQYWLESHSISQIEAARGVAGHFNVLVIDVGGGTTDFSLFSIENRPGTKGPLIQRIAVGEHLLLGGDNIDLALAHELERRHGEKLKPAMFAQLVQQCRELKERALSSGGPEEAVYYLSVAGEGRDLFAKARTFELERDSLEHLVLDGFFPEVAREAKIERNAFGIREWGLPYETDTAITRHLTAFLEGHSADAVLFNGGALRPEFLRRRILDLLERWQGFSPVVLENAEMDLAVAKGAAVYAELMSSGRRTIKAGYPHAVFVELGGKEKEQPSLLCMLPKGTEPNHPIALRERKFKLQVNTAARFQLHTSLHHDSKAGEIVTLEEGRFAALPPIQTRLPHGTGVRQDLVDVYLEANYSQTGLLELQCVDPEGHRWRLDFNLRRADAAKPRAGLEVATDKVREVLSLIEHFYGSKKTLEEQESPKSLIPDLERILGKARDQWSTVLLRMLWTPLAKGVTKRGRSPAHEITWLSLAGFVLRPGYGAELDEYRIPELWRCYELGLSHRKDNSAATQWWIMWRRVAGGLDRSKQQILLNALMPQLLKLREIHPEQLHAAASLERLPVDQKIEICDLLMNGLGRLSSHLKRQALISLGRIGTRVPLYGGLESVLPPEIVESWYDMLAAEDWRSEPYSACRQLFLTSARITGDRARDLSSEVRKKILHKLRASGASDEDLTVVAAFVSVEETDRNVLFGEKLPSGLLL